MNNDLMKDSCLLTSSCIALAFVFATSAKAGLTEQYASTVIGFSSQWEPCVSAATAALGPPDTFDYGDYSTAWSPRPMNEHLEYITLGFATGVYATGTTIRETYGNGYVYQVDALDFNNQLHTVWTGIDPSLPGTPVDFMVSWAATSYLVQGLKIYVNTDHNLHAWEEMDSLMLTGSLTAVPETSTWVAGLSAVLAALGMFARQRRK